MNSSAFEKVLIAFTQGLAVASRGRLIAIDGKTLRRSVDRGGRQAALHMINAWDQRNHLVLGQLAIDASSNEISALPHLLALLDVRGAVVSLDAMHCQKDTAAAIRQAKADYLLTIKANQKTLHEDLQLFFDDALEQNDEGLHHTVDEPDRNPAKKQAKRGRPRTPEETREIVLRLAHEMDSGFTRLWGELRKLDINIGKTMLRNILKEHRIDPGPKRMTGGTWDQFVKRRAQTLWACDFVAEKVWTLRGRMDCFFLFFIHIESRQVWVSPATINPTTAWTAQQARNFVMWLHEQNLSIRFLLRDGDNKFQSLFDLIIETEDAEVIKIPYRSPNMNAFAERWVQSVRNECLNHFIIVGTSHFNHLINEYVDHYNTERPHQGRDNAPLTGDWSEPAIAGIIKCKKRLGGVLRHYYREVA